MLVGKERPNIAAEGTLALGSEAERFDALRTVFMGVPNIDTE